jgi:filamentous hemagglutinin family protein
MPNITDFLELNSWSGKIKPFMVLPTAFSLFLGTRTSVSAQIVPDSTLPSNSIVTPNGDVIEITEGTPAGSNLFHSFETFSVPTGGTAFFNNALTIENIITRVTGGSISNIDGTIRANGSANLFLLNPNGIIFGPNASLNIDGSFVASTANSIKFADGSEFSATNPQAPPLLTINVPVGLQYGTNPGEIVVEGTGNNLLIDPLTFAIFRDQRPAGLQVEEGQTLALVGGSVSLEGGNLTAPEGRIELGSVSSEGLVTLTPTNPGWQLSYENVGEFQDIRLAQAASVDTSGNGGGNIQVQGRRVTLTDGSAILANTLGNSVGGNLTVKASEALEVIGTSANLPFYSGLFADVAPGATGGGGNLTIESDRLLVADGAQIGANTFGPGQADELIVRATEIELIGGSPLGPSGLFSVVAPGATGNGGNITIESDRLLLVDGGQISTNTFGDGKAGELIVRAKEVELIGASPLGPSGLLSGVEPGATGNGGNITIESDRLLLVNGAQISTNTFGSGDAGNLTVKATEIEVIGNSPFEPFFSSSRLSTSVQVQATGSGGDLTIQSDRLHIADGAQISVGTFGAGDAGALSITAQSTEVIGESPFRPSGLFAPVGFDATGKGGDLMINTDRLRVVDGAQISVSTAGLGNAGELTINASESVELIGVSPRGASGLFASAVFGTGEGGDIRLNTNSLKIQDGATINVGNFSTNPNIPPGQGKAGNIEINTNAIILDSTIANNPSNITASTVSGGGGNIILQVQDSLIASHGSQISAETFGSGNGGSIEIFANSLELSSNARISTNSEGLGQAGNIAIETDRLETNGGEIVATSRQTGGGNIDLVSNFILLENGSLISTSVQDSTGGGGNITIDTDLFIAIENSDIRADAVLGPGGNIQISTQGLFPSPDSEITASSQFGVDGAVEITNPNAQKTAGVVKLPETVSDRAQQIVTGCPAGKENVFVVTGRGGLPEDPSQTIRGETYWLDWRSPTQARQEWSQDASQESASFSQSPIVQAQGWVIRADGTVELVAQVPNTLPHSFESQQNQCRNSAIVWQ